jgi:zinc protease
VAVDWGRIEIDGVPVFWSGDGDGDEFHVGLVFRVGHADESLPERGITHLVEHLALHGFGSAVDHVNGVVDAVTTTFYRHGSAEDVVVFLRTVCGALRALPTDRIEAEVQLLRTEAAGRPYGPAERLLLWRYGADGYGTAGYEEFGLGHHTPERLRAWAGQWFTRGNAVLWLVGGPPPDGLRIDLPDGQRIRTPEPSNMLPRTPAYFSHPGDGVAMLSVIDRGTAASAYSLLLRRTLYQVLRGELSVSYSPTVTYDPRDGHNAHVLATADGLSEVSRKLMTGFVDVLDRLVDAPSPDSDLADVTTTMRKGVRDRRSALAAALAELLGTTPASSEELLGEIDALTGADIQAVAAQVRDNALLMVPRDVGSPGNRYAPAPTGSVGTVEGTVLLPAGDAPGRLVVGPTGVSRVAGLTFTTVKYADCRLVNAWPDGTRQLFGNDGLVVYVDPSAWQGGEVAPGVIDAHVPPSVVLTQPAQPATETPPAPPPQPQPTRRRGLFRRR